VAMLPIDILAVDDEEDFLEMPAQRGNFRRKVAADGKMDSINNL